MRLSQKNVLYKFLIPILIIFAVSAFLIIYKLLVKMRSDVNIDIDINHFTFLLSIIAIFVGIFYGYSVSKRIKIYLSFGKTRKALYKDYIKNIMLIVIMLLIINLIEILLNKVIYDLDKNYLFESLIKMIYILSAVVFAANIGYINGLTIKKMFLIIMPVVYFSICIVFYYLNIDLIYILMIIINIIGITFLEVFNKKIMQNIEIN